MRLTKLILVAAMLMVLFACSSNKTKEVEVVEPMNKTWTTETGLTIEILKAGEGEVATKGQTVFVHYTGWLLDGTKFDSSVDRDTPFSFPLGGGRVIKGWDEGVSLMQIGAKYRFIIPAELGYGSRAQGPIPAGSTLIFDVELISFN
jgi:FKBP-type peptidyl-prolyl cis-trans isomerase